MQVINYLFSGINNFLFPNRSAESSVEGAKNIEVSLDLLSKVTGFIGSPVELGKWVRAQYGDVATFVAPNQQRFLFVSSPEVIQQILKMTDRGSNDAFDKSQLLGDGGGELWSEQSLIGASNKEWKAQHESMSKLFSRGTFQRPESCKAIQEAVTGAIEEISSRVKRAGGQLEVDLHAETALIALRVTMEVIFGIKDFSHERLVEIRDASRIYNSTFPSEAFSPFRIPHSKLSLISEYSAQVVEATSILNSFVDEMLEKGRALPKGSSPTFLTTLLEMHDSNPQKISTQQLRENLLLFMFAGHESSAGALGYSIGRVASDKGIEDRIIAESQVTGSLALPTLSTLLESSPTTHAVLQESLRWHPPIYLLLRRATKEVQVTHGDAKICIPEGAEIFLDLYSAHRDEDWYGEVATGYVASEFCAGRWLPNSCELTKSGNFPDLFSFGFGPRVCIGAFLFKVEALFAIQEWEKTFTTSPLFQDIDEGLTSDFTLQRNGGIPARITLR